MSPITSSFRGLGLALALAASAALADGSPVVGQPAPAFSAVDSQGKTVSLAEFAGKTVVLEWSNDSCPFVKKHYGSGNMQALQKTYTGKGVVWLTVISSAPGKQGYVDGAAANRLSVSRGAAPTHVLLDPQGKLGRQYDAKTTPQLFVVDGKGTLVYSGGIDSIASADADDIPKSEPYVKEALDEVLAGKPVSKATTRPYGCSVKYAG